MNQVLTRNSLNVEYRKQKPQRPKVENFKTELLKCLTAIKDADAINESEEFMKAHTYTLVFPPLSKSTKAIDIIEKEAPGNYFNYYNIEYQRWINIEPHNNYIKNKN